MTEKIKAHLEKKTKSDMCLIPCSLTSQLQPADLSWNKPFKTAYCELYNEWMASSEKLLTAGGSMKAPEKVLYLQWVKTAWATISSQTKINPFINCGISVETDGSEDAQIHCIKARQMAVSVAAAVSAETAKLFAGTDEHTMDLDSDPFASDVEEDEVVIEDDQGTVVTCTYKNSCQ